MPFVLDPHSGIPVYRQLMDQVRCRIAGGELRAGDELPSVRLLSESLGVNPMTISKAYSLLERDGLLERRPGRPLTVKALPAADLRRNRDDQLREALLPGALAARQLGVDPDTAADLLRKLMEEER